MTTVVPGLIKIGKTGSANFEQRMYNLEHNGYSNVTGLKRSFAIEVEDYEDKEVLLHTIFEKSQVADTELFSVDVNIARQLLSSCSPTFQINAIGSCIPNACNCVNSLWTRK